MIKTYLFLAGAVLFEVAGTMLLPVTQNFTKLIPTSALAFFYLCFLSFNFCSRWSYRYYVCNMERSWNFTIAILGYIFFKQTLAWQAILGLFLIVIGIILVNSFTGKLS